MLTKRRRNRRKNDNNGGWGLAAQTNYTNFENVSNTFLEPHKYICMKYNDVYQPSVTTLAGSQAVYRLNSIFDPDASVGGHQPYGYDQMAALYNRYRVLKARWHIEFGTSTQTYNIVVVPVNGSLATAITNDTTFETACEMPFARTYTQGGSGAPTTVAVGGMALNKLNGVTTTEYLGDDRFEAQIGANPAEVMQLYVGIFNPTGSTVVPFISLTLSYDVDLHDPLPLVGS